MAIRNIMLTFDQYCEEIKKHVFPFHNIDPILLLHSYDELIEKAEYADKMAAKLFKSLGISDDAVKEFESIYPDEEIIPKEKIIEAVTDYINEYFNKYTIKKEGFCLKIKLIGKAVQMRNNENMLGFISEVIDNSTRFVMVDFGDKEGAVKIDIDEIVF